MSKKISIIVPVYNVEKYLNRCIDSILAQTFSDFELILVDDGSPDNCGNICDEYMKKDQRVKVIHKLNGGLSTARNVGTEQAIGEYIVFHDSDDVMHPQMIESLYNSIIQYGAAMSVCDTEKSTYIPNDFFQSKTIKNKFYKAHDEKMLNLRTTKPLMILTAWGKLVKSSIVKKYPFTENKFFEDAPVVCRWISEAGGLVVVEQKLHFYFINRTGITKSKFSVKQMDRLWALDEQISFYKEKNMPLMLKFTREYYLGQAIELLHLSKNIGDTKNAKKLKRIIIDFYKENKTKISVTRYFKLGVLESRYPYFYSFYRNLSRLKNYMKGDKDGSRK